MPAAALFISQILSARISVYTNTDNTLPSSQYFQTSTAQCQRLKAGITSNHRPVPPALKHDIHKQRSPPPDRKGGVLMLWQNSFQTFECFINSAIINHPPLAVRREHWAYSTLGARHQKARP